jgi:DNA segregation ATPase FtsK/SpoIIIE-like protein
MKRKVYAWVLASIFPLVAGLLVVFLGVSLVSVAHTGPVGSGAVYMGRWLMGKAVWSVPIFGIIAVWQRYAAGVSALRCSLGWGVLSWGVALGLTGLWVEPSAMLTQATCWNTGGLLGFMAYRVLVVSVGLWVVWLMIAVCGIGGLMLWGVSVSMPGWERIKQGTVSLRVWSWLSTRRSSAQAVDAPPKPKLSKRLPPSSGVQHTGNYPPIALLDKPDAPRTTTDPDTTRGDAVLAVLHSFGVQASVANVTVGPSVTRYELSLGQGVKLSKVMGLANDIALKLASPNVRIEAIAGQSLVGIEVPNPNIQSVRLRPLIESVQSDPDKLLAAMGLSITGEPIIMHLGRMPHVLIAGATGSGKSVCVNTIILSILMRASPDDVRFVMIDPKKVELNLYEGIPHLLAPVVTDSAQAAATLQKWVLKEMERRYTIFSRLGVKQLEGYNKKVTALRSEYKKNPKKVKAVLHEKLGYDPEVEDPVLPDVLPYIVVIIDELADLMMVAAQDVETTICRLAQMARATGIHLVIATQRPSVNVITGLIKANIPSRISFFLQSQIDSRTILDSGGAEKLMGKGDMLYMPVGTFKPQRSQGVFVSEAEVERVVSFWKKQAKPRYHEDILNVKVDAVNDSVPETEDPMFEDAKTLIQSQKKVSVSLLQRKLKIGYNRASRLMDELEEKGFVSAYDEAQKSRLVIR